MTKALNVIAARQPAPIKQIMSSHTLASAVAAITLWIIDSMLCNHKLSHCNSLHMISSSDQFPLARQVHENDSLKVKSFNALVGDSRANCGVYGKVSNHHSQHLATY